jgi:ribosomal protein S18 acetylase RimI-like enzyme
MVTLAPPVSISAAIDRKVAIGTITAAFDADPVARWFYPRADQYFTWLPKFAEAFGGRAIESGTAHVAEDFAGVALWLPPGVGPDDEAMGAIISESVPESRHEEVFAFAGQMEPFHPHEPHWYLPMIGVDPAYQGRGFGAALLEYALRICDEERRLAYLEASSPRSRALYERHGFEVVGVIQVGSSPPMWPMVRRPR